VVPAVFFAYYIKPDKTHSDTLYRYPKSPSNMGHLLDLPLEILVIILRLVGNHVKLARLSKPVRQVVQSNVVWHRRTLQEVINYSVGDVPGVGCFFPHSTRIKGDVLKKTPAAHQLGRSRP